MGKTSVEKLDKKVDQRNFLVVEMFQLINEAGMRELKHYHFATLSKQIDLGHNHQSAS